MKLIPTSSTLGETQNIIYSRNHLYISMRSTLFVYKYNFNTLIFDCSFDTEDKYIESIAINENHNAKKILVAAKTSNEVYIIDIQNQIFKVLPINALHIEFDRLSEYSLLVSTPDKKLNLISINDDLTYTTKWAVNLYQPLTSFKLSTEDPNTIIGINKISDIVCLNRKGSKFPFELTQSTATLSEEENCKTIDTMPLGFFLISSPHFVHIVHTETFAAFNILKLSLADVLKKVFPAIDDERVFYVLHFDNTIRKFVLSDKREGTPERIYEEKASIKLPPTMLISPVYATSNEIIISTQTMQILTLNTTTEAPQISIKRSIQVPVAFDRSPFAVSNGQVAFIDSNFALNVLIIKTGKTVVRTAIESIKELEFYTQDSVVYLSAGHVFKLNFGEEFELEELDMNGYIIDAIKVVKERAVVGLSGQTLIINELGKVTEKKFTNLADFHPCLNGEGELVVVLALDGRGIFFADSKMSPVYGNFPQASIAYPYKRVLGALPTVYAFDAAGRLFVFDVSAGGCQGKINATLPELCLEMPHDHFVAAATPTEVYVFSPKPEVSKVIPLANEVLVAVDPSNFYTASSSRGLSVLPMGSNIRPYFEIDFDTIPVPAFFNYETSMDRVQRMMAVLSASDDQPDDTDDIKLLLGEKPRDGDPSTTKDPKRVYHRLLLSFVNKRMDDEHIGRLKEFAIAFANDGAHLSAAAVKHIVGDYRSAAESLIDAQMYSLAAVYAQKHYLAFEEKLVCSYAARCLENDDTAMAFLALMRAGRKHAALSLLYEKGFFRNLQKNSDHLQEKLVDPPPVCGLRMPSTTLEDIQTFLEYGLQDHELISDH